MIRPVPINFAYTILAMGRRLFFVLGLLAMPFAGLNCTKVKNMTKNQTYLEEARTKAKGFQDTQEPERLKESYFALENVLLQDENDLKTRARLRMLSLDQWLQLIQLVDGARDPKFDPNEVPERTIQPPPTSKGVVPPGADPALIDDPKARAEYEKTLATHRAKVQNYRLQIHLGRLNESITPRAEGFILDSYTQAPADQEEVRTAIEKTIKDPRRKAKLLKLVRPAQP